MLILLITAPLALVVVGRRAFCLTTCRRRGGAIDRHASWLIPMLMGTLQPFLIITGTAWAMTPIATGQLSKSGYEMINGPGMLASNVAMGAATLCVALKTKIATCASWPLRRALPRCWGSPNRRCTGAAKFRRVLIAAMRRRARWSMPGERAGALRLCLARSCGAAGVYRRKPDEHRPCAGDLRDFHRGDLYPDSVYRLQRCS